MTELEQKLQDRLNKAVEVFKTMKEESAAKDKTISELNDKIDNLTKSVEQYKNDYYKIMDEYSDLEQSFDSVFEKNKKDISELEKVISNLKETSANKSDEIERLNSLITDYEKFIVAENEDNNYSDQYTDFITNKLERIKNIIQEEFEVDSNLSLSKAEIETAEIIIENPDKDTEEFLTLLDSKSTRVDKQTELYNIDINL